MSGSAPPATMLLHLIRVNGDEVPANPHRIDVHTPRLGIRCPSHFLEQCQRLVRSFKTHGGEPIPHSCARLRCIGMNLAGGNRICRCDPLGSSREARGFESGGESVGLRSRIGHGNRDREGVSEESYAPQVYSVTCVVTRQPERRRLGSPCRVPLRWRATAGAPSGFLSRTAKGHGRVPVTAESCLPEKTIPASALPMAKGTLPRGRQAPDQPC